MSDYNIPVSGGVNGLNVPLHGHIAVYNKEFPVIPNPEGEVTGYVTKLGFTPEILQVKDPEVHDWARAEEKPTYTKAEVGLGNVDNTSDLNKPISTATQTALDGKVDKVPGKALSTNDYTDTDKAIVDGVTSALATKVDKIAGKGLSSNDYTDYEKTKLAYIQSGAEVNVQADWFEANRWSDAFILNKPTKLSDFSNDTGFITSTVDNLTYYYKKSETYTQAEVNALIGSIVTISFLVVQELPQTGEANIIYLVPADEPNPDNIYEEYIYVNNNWEMIGTTKVDLSNYYTKTETNTLLNGKVDKDGDKVLSDNNYSDTDKTKLDGIEANANHTEVDTEISSTSENPLQNKAIYDLLNNLLPEAEETGNPISISNASGFNAKALTVDMLPIQAGNGTPSPDNIRPISGRTSLDVTVNGKNLVSSKIEHCNISNGGLLQSYSSTQYDMHIAKVKANTTYTLKTNDNTFVGGFFTSIPEVGSTTYNGQRVVSTTTFTAPIDGYVAFRSEYGYSTAQLEVGSSSTTYEPYKLIDTETINFGETVYGGTCDVVNGGTSDEWQIVNVTSAEDIRRNNAKQYYIRSSIAFEVDSTNIVSNKFKTASSGNGVCFLNQNGNIRFNTVDEYESTEALFNAIGNIQFVAKLATPTTLTTPATSISLNKGNNTLSTSGDNMDLKYSTTISNPTPSLSMARPTLSLSSPTVAEPTVEEPTEESEER